MCAGVTTYNALRHSGARAGDVVAVLGIGGLGHLGVQFAAKMGFRTVAIARGEEKRELAAQARRGFTTSTADRRTSAARAATRTAGRGSSSRRSRVSSAMEPVVGGLAVDGQLLIVGASPRTAPGRDAPLIGARVRLGLAVRDRAGLRGYARVQPLTGVRPMIETLPLERAAEAYERMMSGAARFRMVLRSTRSLSRNAAPSTSSG